MQAIRGAAITTRIGIITAEAAAAATKTVGTIRIIRSDTRGAATTHSNKIIIDRMMVIDSRISRGTICMRDGIIDVHLDRTVIDTCRRRISITLDRDRENCGEENEFKTEFIQDCTI